MAGRFRILRTVVVLAIPLLTAHAIKVSAGPRQAAGSEQAAAEALIEASDCTSCHAIDRTLVGPSYLEVAARYAGQAGAADQIGLSIREGGSGTWGDVRMTAHPDLENSDLERMVAWILSLTNDVRAVGEAEAASTAEYAYTLAEGEKVTLDFQMFVEGEGPEITREVFGGYLLYNSYCFRCHGQDATQSQLAPDLKRSLGNGMTSTEFLAVAMAGNEDAGMPSWAGFLTVEEVRQTYMYVEGRRLGLIPVGRPPSDY